MKPELHARHRKQLMRMVGEGGIVILPASPQHIRNRDVEYPYRSDSDFMYLSGFPEPDAVIVLVPGRDKGEYILFCRDRDEEQEIWHGRRSTVNQACSACPDSASGSPDAKPSRATAKARCQAAKC